MNADALRDFIEGNQYDYIPVGDDAFRLRFCSGNGDYTMFAHAPEEPPHVLVFTYCPVKIPEERRLAAADYLNRVNYGLVLGCLEMDPSDGEVRSRSTAPLGSSEPDASVFSPLFDSSYYLVDNWLRGLLQVAFGSEDPARAYAAALDALRGDQPPADCTADNAQPASGVEPEAELTAIEQEVSRLLAEHDADAEASGPSR